MKKITTLLAITAFAGLAVIGCKKTEEAGSNTSTSSPSEASVEEKTISLKVTGMTWPTGCVGKVRSALTSVEGVTKATVAMPDKAEVTGTADSATLIAAIEKAGFQAAVQ